MWSSGVVDYVVDDGSCWKDWRFWRWLSGGKNGCMHGGDNGSGKGVIVGMRSKRIDSMDAVGSAVVASGEQDRGGTGGGGTPAWDPL